MGKCPTPLQCLPRDSKAKEQGLLTFPPQPLLWQGKGFILINFCTFVMKQGGESFM